MAKRKSGSKCTMNSQMVKLSKKPKKSKKPKNIWQPVGISKLPVDIQDETQRSQRNVSVTPSKEKNGGTPSEKKPLKTLLKRQVANQNIHNNSVTEITKSVQKSSRLLGPTRCSNSLQNELETFEITGKKSRKSFCQTPRKSMKERKRALISQTELEESGAEVSFEAYTDPPTASIRRSTRHASRIQIKKEKSPADVGFGAYHDLAKETFESPAKKPRKTQCETTKKPLQETKRALINPSAVSLRRSIRHASGIQIKLEESPADVGFGAYHDLAEETFETTAKKPRKTPCKAPKKPLKMTKLALITPPAVSLRRSIRLAPSIQIKLEESPDDSGFGAFHDLAKATFETPAKRHRKTPCETPKKPLKETKRALINPSAVSLRRSIRQASGIQIKLEESPAVTGFGTHHYLTEETFECLGKKSRKIPSQPPKKPVNKTRRVLFSQVQLEESSADVSLGAYNDPLVVPSRRSTKRATISKIDQEKSPGDKTPKTPIKSPSKTSNQKRIPSTSVNVLSPVIKKRTFPITDGISDVETAKKSLHVSAVVKHFPCREREFDDIYLFIETKILDESGGCLYVCGCPGSGKTATIKKVLKSLQLKVQQKKLPSFECVEINGMKLTKPTQAYVQIYRQLTGQTLQWEKAHLLLEKKFLTRDTNRKMTILLVDELDILCNHRQDVIYNLLDWSTKQAAKLAVITVANAVDLPERSLKGKVSSRLGMTRLVFQPYSQKQLTLIMQARLMGITNIFDSDTVELVARKVATISGDCRRALDICRRAVEIAERECNSTMDIIVSMTHVQAAFNDMITNPKVLAMTKCSKYEKLFLQAVEAEVTRTGVDETNLLQVYQQYETICALNGVNVPEVGAALRMSSKLGSSRLLICEHSSASIHQKIMLNVSHDDIYKALHVMT